MSNTKKANQELLKAMDTLMSLKPTPVRQPPPDPQTQREADLVEALREARDALDAIRSMASPAAGDNRLQAIYIAANAACANASAYLK